MRKWCVAKTWHQLDRYIYKNSEEAKKKTLKVFQKSLTHGDMVQRSEKLSREASRSQEWAKPGGEILKWAAPVNKKRLGLSSSKDSIQRTQKLLLFSVLLKKNLEIKHWASLIEPSAPVGRAGPGYSCLKKWTWPPQPGIWRTYCTQTYTRFTMPIHRRFFPTQMVFITWICFRIFSWGIIE